MDYFCPTNVYDRFRGQSNSIQHQNREHQCDDMVNLVLTLHPRPSTRVLTWFLRQVPILFPSICPPFQLQSSVKSTDTPLLFPITVLYPLITEVWGYLLHNFPKVQDGCFRSFVSHTLCCLLTGLPPTYPESTSHGKVHLNPLPLLNFRKTTPPDLTKL